MSSKPNNLFNIHCQDLNHRTSMMTNRQMSSWRSIGYWPVFFSYQRVATVTTMRNSLPDLHFRSLHFGLLMTKTVRLIAVFLSCYITLGYANSALSQERLRIDNDTVAVVERPWRLMNVNTKANLRGRHVYSCLLYTSPSPRDS